MFEKKTRKEITDFKSYLRSEKALWFWMTLSIIAVYLIILPFSEVVEVLGVLRVILGGLFVIVIPGYVLTKVLYSENKIDQIERLALSVGLSLAISPIMSFILNFTPYGIKLTPLVGSLSLVVIILAVVGLIREFNESLNQ